MFLKSRLCSLVEYFTEPKKCEGEPDEESIQRIAEHGYDRGQAYTALMTHGNDELAALNYLLSRRNPPATAEDTDLPPPPGAWTQQPGAASVPQGQAQDTNTQSAAAIMADTPV